MNSCILSGIPMPPSINAAYMNRRGRGPGRVKTPAYRAFEQDLALWAARSAQVVTEAARLASDPSDYLQLDAYFCFPHKCLITKAGRAKKLDVDNRLKILNDALGKVLNFDDSRIVRQTIEKIAISGLHQPYVVVELQMSTICLSLPLPP